MWTDRFGKEIKPGDYLAYAVAAGRGSGWLEIGLALKYYDSGALGVIGLVSTGSQTLAVYGRQSMLRHRGAQLVLLPEQLSPEAKQLLDDYYKEYLEKQK